MNPERTAGSRHISQKTGITMNLRALWPISRGTAARNELVSRFTACAVLLLAAQFATVPAAYGAPASPFVQRRDRQITRGTSNSLAFSSPTSAGNLIAVYVIWDNKGAVSLSDTAGNTYLSAVGPTLWNQGAYSAQVFYAKNIAGGNDTVTATFATAIRSFGIIYIHEYSQLDPVSPVDVTAAAVGTSGQLNSGSVATTNANDLLFGAGVSTYIVSGPGSGFTARDMALGNITEDRVVTSQGTYNATANNNGGWGMQMVAFRFAGSVPADITPPSVPTNLTATPVSPTQINLAWTASTDPDNTASQLSYRVFRNGSQIGITSAGSTSWQDTGLISSTTYTYSMSAQDPAGNSSAQTAGVQATTPQAPPSISSFKATPPSITAGQSSTLSWTTSNASSLVIDNGVGTVTSLNSVSVSPATNTTYTLTASNNTSSTTAQLTIAVAADTSSPSVPTLRATAVSSTQADLTWTASTDNVRVAGYQIYRDGNPIAQVSTTSYSDTTLTANKTYSYSVSAFDAAGNHSAQSTGVNVTTPGPDTQSPTISISSPTGNQVVFGTWPVTVNASDNIGVAGVQYALDGSNMGTELATAPYSTSWDTTKVADGTHTLTATARDAAGNTAASAPVTVRVSNSFRKPYTTTFPLTENPISENSRWINGQANGVDWSNVQTTPGFAFGTEPGIINYDDSTALLTGSWGPDQTVEATVHMTNPPSDPNIFEEVELRLRSTLTPHRSTGYEVNFRCSAPSIAYTQIVRWNGPLGSFTLLDSRGGFSVKDGDVVKATIVGNVITSYINGVQALQVTDNTFASGNPGMGFYIQGTSGSSVNRDYGFSSFTASDGSTADSGPPTVPTSLSATAVSSSQINLKWTASTDDVGVIGYQVFRNNVQVATTPTPSFSDTGLVADSSYTYTVAAYDAAGYTSAGSAPATATTLSPDVSPPTVPVITGSSNVTSSSLTISWSASTDDSAVEGYQVFRNGNLVGTTSSTTFTNGGLQPDTTYSYTVAAYDFSNNVSAQSASFQVTTASGPLAPPSFVQVNQNQIANGSNTSAGFNTPTVAGHTIVAYVIWDNTNGASVTDSRGNTFVPVSAPLVWAGKYSAQVFYATNIAGGSDTVTARFQTAASSFGVLYIHEYAGINTSSPVDVTTSTAGSSATMNSGSVTTTSANDLIFGAGVSDNLVSAAGSGFTARDMAFGNITEDRPATATGSVSATASHKGKAWGMQVVAFRGAN